MNETESLFDRARVYLSSSRMLRDTGDYESAVSRCYYAMFYVAEAALLSRGVTGNSHKGVITEFNRVFVKTGVVPSDLGRAFGQAFEKRQLGEYEFRRVITAEDAGEIEQKAVDFVARVTELVARRVEAASEDE